MPASCSAGFFLLLEMLSSPGNARSLPWSYIHTLARPFISAANLSNHSLLLRTYPFLGPPLLLIVQHARMLTETYRLCLLPAKICLCDPFGASLHVPSGAGSPYGDVCTRDTGRILTRARAFPQIVGSREEEEGKGRAKEGVKGSIRPGTSADGGDGRSYSLHGGA